MASQSMRYLHTSHSPSWWQQTQAVACPTFGVAGLSLQNVNSQSTLQPIHKFVWMHDQLGIEGAARTSRLKLRLRNTAFSRLVVWR